MSVTLLVMTDGRRECITRAIGSMGNITGPVSVRVIHDDSGDADYEEWLWATFPGWIVTSTGRRSGFAGAYRSAWDWLRLHDRNPWVFSTEDDFVFRRRIDLHDLAGVMTARPELVQMALRRQPWNDEEREAGGIVESHPADFVDCFDGTNDWLEHRRFFTTNPSLLRRTFIQRNTWPTGKNSEGRFGFDLFKNPALRSGFWGARDSGEWVEHIGHQRVGTGY